MFFNAGCNERVFSKPGKKFRANTSCRFQEKRTTIQKNDVIEPKNSNKQ